VVRLEPGMYVAGLDRPWLETPFAVQGFYILSDNDIANLAEYCEHVYIDPRLVTRTSVKKRPSTGRNRVVANPVPYDDGVSMRDEFICAEENFESASSAVAGVFDKVRAGQHLDIAAVSKAINPLIDSVLRNKDALAALARVRRKDDYTYSHSISTAVWSAVLGRHLGLDVETLRVLALGCALIDVGKLRIPEAILSKPTALTDEEFAEARNHVEHSLSIVRDSQGVDPRVVDVIAGHHERHDGSGYPLGQAGDSVPLLARIAGLADSYDAMITPRPYAEARSSFEAMNELGDLKDAKFQAELVEQFMQAVGLFPTGSLVELSTGEVGVVVAQNATRRLKPKVMIVLNTEKRRAEPFVVVDLMTQQGGEQHLASMWITRELAPGAYGIDAEEFYL